MKSKQKKYDEAVERSMKMFRENKNYYRVHFFSLEKTKQKLGIKLSDKSFDEEIINSLVI